MNNYIDLIHENTPKANLPTFKPGDTICVYYKIKEKNKERTQRFQGIVMQQKGQTAQDKTFTLRKISYGTAVERIFPIESPNIDKIELVHEGKVRRAKLFYLRNKKGKAAKVKHKIGPRQSTQAKNNKPASEPQPTQQGTTPPAQA